ncbi:GPW/gp25 family protein [bacterium]|nr:GPW/gp25 family protein [bacterium]
MRAASREEQVKSALRCALLTRQGELPLSPEFGSQLHTFLFRAFSESLVAEMKAEVRRAVASETRVKLVDVEIQPDTSEPDRLDLKIAFEYRESLKPGSMKVSLHG